MPTTEELKLLFAEFPREDVSWRAQSMTAAGDKALALAFIDARDVMGRLDDVCGPADWQDRYEFHGNRTICYLSIRVNNEWITKADGAGDSDVEAEKGAISDALKRAAVKWGIGRYLYSIESPWVACDSYEKGNKKHWKRWTEDPWSRVRGAKPIQAKPAVADLIKQIPTTTRDHAMAWKDKHNAQLDALSDEDFQRFKLAWAENLKRFAKPESDDFPGDRPSGRGMSDAEARNHPMNAG